MPIRHRLPSKLSKLTLLQKQEAMRLRIQTEKLQTEKLAKVKVTTHEVAHIMEPVEPVTEPTEAESESESEAEFEPGVEAFLSKTYDISDLPPKPPQPPAVRGPATASPPLWSLPVADQVKIFLSQEGQRGACELVRKNFTTYSNSNQ